MDQIKTTLRMKNEADQKTISSLETEITHIKIQMEENRTLKEQYYEKAETIQVKYQDLFGKLNLIQKDIVAIDEIKRDRDERLGQMRDELEEISIQYDELSKANSALTVKFQHMDEEMATLQGDYKKLLENFDRAVKVRQETEELLDKK